VEPASDVDPRLPVGDHEHRVALIARLEDSLAGRERKPLARSDDAVRVLGRETLEQAGR
jgi:hypothetical protein